jgi:predicted Zn finger-like uncharacterized protein
MLIVCPSCASEYTIDPAKLGADGRTLRCAICRDTWFVSPAGQPAQWPSVADEPRSEMAPVPVADRPAARWISVRPGFTAAVLAALLMAIFLAFPGLRHGIEPWIMAGVRSMAHPVPEGPAPLEFRHVTSELIREEGPSVLVVGGEIVNAASKEVNLPHLEILVRNEDEQVLASWTSAPPQQSLGSGEAVHFETRLSSPPPDGRQVRVHFTAAGGIAVAARSPDQRIHP